MPYRGLAFPGRRWASGTLGRDGRVLAHFEKYYDACAQIGTELEGLQDEKVYAIVAYRRAVDFARSMGFYEQYEY